MSLSIYKLSFYLIILTVFSVSSYLYIARRMICKSKFSLRKQKILKQILLLMAFLPLITLPLRFADNDSLDFLVFVAFTSMGLLSFLIVYSVIRDFLFLLLKQFITPSSANPHNESSSDSEFNRKQFLMSSLNKGVFTASIVSSAFGMHQAYNSLQTKRVHISLPNLPTAFENFRIVQISDIHAGALIRHSYLEKIRDEVNKLNADVVAITGDLVDGSVKALSDTIKPLFEMESTFGSYFVTGNHEYYSGAESWVEYLRKSNFQVLMNENVILKLKGQKLALGGITDYQAHRYVASHRSDVDLALRGIEDVATKVLLAHRPRSIFQAEKKNFDLMLCGHTHGGQFFPWNYIVYAAQPYVKGLYQHKSSQLYVNAGTGFWGPPARLGISAEITEIILHQS